VCEASHGMGKFFAANAVPSFPWFEGNQTTTHPNFDVLLTVRLSITLVILMHKFLFYNKFIIFLYMFRALL